MSPKKPSNRKSQQKRKKESKFVLWASWIFLGLVVVGAVFLIYLRNRPAQPSVSVVGPLPSEVDVDTAYLMYTNEAFLLDVRDETSYRVVYIPNTVNIPLDQLSDRLDEVPQGVDIVVVDDHGEQAAQGRDILLEAGFRRVTVMDGGLEAWILERNYLFRGVYPR